MPTESVMPSNHLILYRPLLLLPSIFPSIRVFSNESSLHNRWPKYWSFSISPANEYSGLISFRIDWFDLLAVQGTLKSSPTPQFKSISSSALSFLYAVKVPKCFLSLSGSISSWASTCHRPHLESRLPGFPTRRKTQNLGTDPSACQSQDLGHSTQVVSDACNGIIILACPLLLIEFFQV